MSAYRTVVERYRERPEVQVFDEFQYRVTLRGWHIHQHASYGRLGGDGKSLDDACKKLLENADKPSSMVVQGDCSDACHDRYVATPAFKLASEEFWAFVKQQGQKARKVLGVPEEPKSSYQHLMAEEDEPV